MMNKISAMVNKKFTNSKMWIMLAAGILLGAGVFVLAPTFLWVAWNFFFSPVFGLPKIGVVGSFGLLISLGILFGGLAAIKESN